MADSRHITPEGIPSTAAMDFIVAFVAAKPWQQDIVIALLQGSKEAQRIKNVVAPKGAAA